MRNHLSEIQSKDEKYHGIWRGVVEDNKDPEGRGRCKVRVFGKHDSNINVSNGEGIPTDNLPWAEPALGLFEGSVSGFGTWTVPLQGSHVYCFFENANKQQIRFFASAPGVPTQPSNTREGFNDPDGIYPLGHRLNEPDWHRLARDVSDNTIVDHKQDNLDQGVQLALGQGEWDEPDPFYTKTTEKYPNNVVIATHNGILFEIDSSEEPRIHIFHPSNSYIEIDNEGNKIIRNNGVRYDIIIKDFNQHVKESKNTTVDNNQTTKVGNSEYLEVGANREQEIKGNVTIEIGGDKEITINGSKNITIGGNCDVQVGGDCNITTGGNTTISAGGSCQVTAANISLNG